MLGLPRSRPSHWRLRRAGGAGWGGPWGGGNPRGERRGVAGVKCCGPFVAACAAPGEPHVR
eukprot:3882381-Alexandrium_andersonii.AAC.1